VGDYDSVIVGGTSSAVSSYSSAQDKGSATVSGNQMSVELEGSAWKSLDHFKQITEMTVMIRFRHLHHPSGPVLHRGI